MKIKIKDSPLESEPLKPRKTRVVKKNLDSQFEKSGVNNKKSNLHYLLYFIFAVIVCVVLALAFRIAVTVKNSTFSTPSYAVLVSSDTPFLISVDTASKKLAIIGVDTRNSNNRLQKSMQLKTPLDGKIYKKNGSITVDDFPSVKFLWSVVTRPWEYGFEGMTPFDAFKLTQYALGIQEKDVVRRSMSVSKEGSLEGIDAQELYDIFKDPMIINEQQSIEVINGTGQEGLAGQVSLILKNAGGNVVSVGSSDDVPQSSLKASQTSHSVERISHALSITPTIDENFASISDIKIVLGQDFVKRLK